MRTLLLLHSGIGDRRQWAPQLDAWRGRFELVAPDLPGFGSRPLEPRGYLLADEAVAALDEAGAGRAVVVGSSLGGRVALETAQLHPERVEALVLVAAGLTGWEPSDELRRAQEREEELFEAGELEAAAELMVATWVPGAPDEVRRYVRDAQLAAYRLDDERASVERPELRLGELDVPALVLYGERDLPDFREVAEKLARELPRAEGPYAIAGAHHLPNLEAPQGFDAAVLPFLERL